MTVWDANISAENESAAAIDDSRTCGLGVNEWTDGRTDRQTDERTDRRTDGWMDTYIVYIDQSID